MGTYVNRLGSSAPRIGALSADSDVAVWALAATSDVVGGYPVAEALPMLDAAERDRAGRLLREGDRRRYLASHVGLRVLLGGYLGLAPADVVLVRDTCPCCGGPHGRPAVDGAAPHFSLSHSDDMAYFAFAGVPVGVDVQAISTPAAVADVLAALHPAETAELTALPEADRPAATGRVWSRKEACLKATGVGLARGLAEPYVSSARTPAAVPGWTLTDLPAPPGYTAALAVATTASVSADARA
ncbi:4'-phosphopantetheinyl transferase superfamily protein [Streptomyces sp. ISL-43]|uniref:4'-phosphopantetheinyl transferase family protein n=1 Tax=Streptomyces sp. ISL-43 TaxID=2819183 RepID=UPI0027E547AA|nr:4'-phosphopantetheinyl transferase superfamily protein [Streptomyces sp. ISL-43]